MIPYRRRRHERFSKRMAADPVAQILYEREREAARDFILDCLDLAEGRATEGARLAKAELDRVARLTSEAKRRALVGADPLNITKHTKGKAAKQKLGADPIEYVGSITRTRPAVSRLTGKNKLDQHQALAAEAYRNAFEAVHATLGGAMDFSGAKGATSGGHAPAEAALIASQSLATARKRLGVRATIIVEQIVCQGRSIEETARLAYSYSDGQPTAARDINYVGRCLRESLDEIGTIWHPKATKRKKEFFRPSKEEVKTGDAGLRTVGGVAPYVTR
jgi:hypothetical protein